MKNKKLTKKALMLTAFTSFTIIGGSAGAVDIANVPLSISSYVKPNMMLVVDNSGSMKNGVSDSSKSRMEVAKEVSTAFVSELKDNVRIGLTAFHNLNKDKSGTSGNASKDGGMLLQLIEDATPAKKASVIQSIAGLNPDTWTPLAETLSDVALYMSYGGSGSLTLHPGESGETQKTPAQLFEVDHRNNSNFNRTGKSLVAPVQYSCQKNFAILITDGEPTEDKDISSHLKNYSGAGGNVYLDDVAQALFEMDLRPDLTDNQGNINNLRTYTIGFAEPNLKNSSLLENTAKRAGGNYVYAENAGKLKTALESAVESFFDTLGSISAVTSNSSRLDTASAIYQSTFDSSDWSGELIKYAISSTGTLGAEAWKASEKLPAHGDRNIFTWTDGDGEEFKYNQLSTSDQAQMGSSNVVEYLRGDQSGEESNNGNFRNRTSLLGDIINSDATYVSQEDFGYKNTVGGGGGSYAAYLLNKKSVPPMIYVGANDGMLHGFNASSGEEEFAYVPGGIVSNGAIASLSSPSYVHSYLVDGSVSSGDAFFDKGTGTSEWSTYIAGSTGAGGKSVFALDVGDPTNFDEDDVMWEYTHNELGYTLGKPVIARLSHGGYAVVFGNGYNSDSHSAQLFIVNLKTGVLLKKIDVGVGSASDHNGLATPTLVDTDGDRRVDTIYAGDLKGNLWKFDLSSSTKSDWGVAYTSGGNPQPMFSAKNGSAESQPITSDVEIGDAPTGQNGYMVYFGTGSFFANSDKSDMTLQSLYGIWDNGSAITTTDRSELLQQEILVEGTTGDNAIRVTSDYDLDTDIHKGWYMDLVSPGGSPVGERVVSAPLLRHGRAIFSTILPSSSSCSAGGTSWLMEMDAEDGSRLNYAALDLDGDMEFDEDDFVTVDTNDGEIKAPITGIQFGEGLIRTPTVISDGEIEFKIASDSGAGIDILTEKGSVMPPRTSWRQLDYR